jgi:hypothetical protein
VSKSKQENEVSKKSNGERAVVVTTQHRGVFFGYTDDTTGAIITLRAARNCLYWSAEQKGFLGLASMGPVRGCRVGPAVDLELRDITSVAACTPEAVKAWEAAPWSA